ncbi:MAG: OmpA family protein, partial [bacterium]|nr:OmpA family protein [bacterium]
RFGFEQSRLDAEAATALDRFAEQLLTAGGGIFIEIQGHTDASGSEEYNLELGYERAQAVRRYLSMRHGLPLHRMSVISYGKASPVADNNTREGRAKNRRVVLVVLK